MPNDIMLIFVGGVLGFISAILLELIKNRLEEKRSKQEIENNSLESKEKNVRNFLSQKNTINRTPAWVKLVKTYNSRKSWKIIKRPELDTDTSPVNLQKTIHLSQEDIRNNIEKRNKNIKIIKKYLLSNFQIIGRQETCEICIQDESISRLHALIKYENKNYIIYDLGSSSGTYVNDKEVAENGTPLKYLDMITLGNSVFVFESINQNLKQKKQDL